MCAGCQVPGGHSGWVESLGLGLGSGVLRGRSEWGGCRFNRVGGIPALSRRGLSRRGGLAPYRKDTTVARKDTTVARKDTTVARKDTTVAEGKGVTIDSLPFPSPSPQRPRRCIGRSFLMHYPLPLRGQEGA